MAASLIFHTKRVPPEAAVVMIIPVWLITYLQLRKSGRTFTDIGLNGQTISFSLPFGLLIGAGFMSIVFGVLIVTEKATFGIQPASPSLLGALLAGFGSIFLGSGTEELIFRGYLMSVLARKGQLFGIIVTAALFSVAHFWQGINPIGWINLFLFGVLAAQLFFLTRNLWMPIGFHAGWNFFQMKIFGFPMYGNVNSGVFRLTPSAEKIISGGSYGPEGSLITTILLLAGIATAYRLTNGGAEIPLSS